MNDRRDFLKLAGAAGAAALLPATAAVAAASPVALPPLPANPSPPLPANPSPQLAADTVAQLIPAEVHQHLVAHGWELMVSKTGGETIAGGITKETLLDAIAQMPKTPANIEPVSQQDLSDIATALMNLKPFGMVGSYPATNTNGRWLGPMEHLAAFRNWWENLPMPAVKVQAQTWVFGAEPPALYVRHWVLPDFSTAPEIDLAGLLASIDRKDFVELDYLLRCNFARQMARRLPNFKLRDRLSPAMWRFVSPKLTIDTAQLTDHKLAWLLTEAYHGLAQAIERFDAHYRWDPDGSPARYYSPLKSEIQRNGPLFSLYAYTEADWYPGQGRLNHGPS